MFQCVGVVCVCVGSVRFGSVRCWFSAQKCLKGIVNIGNNIMFVESVRRGSVRSGSVSLGLVW